MSMSSSCAITISDSTPFSTVILEGEEIEAQSSQCRPIEPSSPLETSTVILEELESFKKRFANPSNLECRFPDPEEVVFRPPGWGSSLLHLFLPLRGKVTILSLFMSISMLLSHLSISA